MLALLLLAQPEILELPKWLGPSLFSVAVLVGAWSLKGKTDRWDETAKRSHEHATILQTLTLKVDMLEQKEKPNARRRP